MVVVLVVAVALAGLGAGSGTAALFFDTRSAGGTIALASSFDSTPPGEKAWDDVDGDEAWDPGEPTYNESELYAFSNGSVDLIVPSDVGPVDNDTVSIAANSIDVRVPVEGSSGDVTLEATGGDVQAGGKRLNTSGGSVQVTANGTAALNGSTLRALADVNVTAGSVELAGATARSESLFGFVIASATDGRLAATGARLNATIGNVSLASNGDMALEGADIHAEPWVIFGGFLEFFGDATAELGTDTATLHVANAVIHDEDDTLTYSPGNVTVDGTPASGNVTGA